MTSRKKKVPPAREKYDKNNPTVSARMPKDKHDKLLAVLQKKGLTLTQLLIAFADEQEIKLNPIDEARQESYLDGFDEAKVRFQVTYPCSICGEPVLLTSPKSKAAVAKFMNERGGSHADCNKNKPAH